ncbi:MAG: PSD1 domain-containing protein [Armatimonadetes bacterium]|nr:PSD1 domain-containing protein [Armatimonadota bacterium]MDE2205663.1 PSD1 domain-containing protein [Armatimonadota bacterium]
MKLGEPELYGIATRTQARLFHCTLRRAWHVGGTVLALIAAAAFAPPSPAQPTAPPVNFVRVVLPILKAHCFECHGPQKMGGLRMDNSPDFFKGGSSGPIVAPGDSAHSLLVERLLGQLGKPRMPMGFGPLKATDIAKIRAWIDGGAVWKGAPAPTHWAYVAPKRPMLPKVQDRAWARNPIDVFVLAKLQANGLSPAAQASRRTLIRRVSLDLIGLPPTPAEIAAFLKDRSPNAWSKVVDRLLASPHFGEKWAIRWLDLARYADSNGYEKDLPRSMWPYRDWVINAYNKDMPFDQFVVKQIAGDMLPNATVNDRIASGFQRNTMLNQEGGVDPDEQRWLTNVDRVGTLGTVFLGTTLMCAQCHDHKFDPFTQKDFYSMLAFWNHCTEPDLEILTPDQKADRERIGAWIMQASAAKAADAKPGGDAAALPKATMRLASLQGQLAAITGPTTMVFHEDADGKTPSTHIRVKGAYLSRAAKVTANTPASLNPFPAGLPHNRLGLAQWLVSPANPLTARVAVNRFWEDLFGIGIVKTSYDFGTQGSPPSHRRLLDWLAVEFQHPTPNAAWRRDANGHAISVQPWDMKAMIRLIVTSATYMQRSEIPPKMIERDPDNALLARGARFRLGAELIRDEALAISGLLDPKIGGPSVYPYQPAGVWNVPYSGDKWVESKGGDQYRRGIYTFLRRSAPYPVFVNFDGTSHEFCTALRMRTNTPLQALTTLNEKEFFECARALASRMMLEGGATPASRVRFGFLLCTARPPNTRESSTLTALFKRERLHYLADRTAATALLAEKSPTPDDAERAAWTVVANVLLNMDETITRE